MSDVVGNLRTEIVESQKARIDLLKWKIILIAALGAVGFGIGKDMAQGMPIVLGFMPIVCAYVDVLCVHNDLRILVIAAFLRIDTARTSSEAKAYERLCETQRETFFLESFALVGTTVLVSLLVATFCISPELWEMVVPAGPPPGSKLKPLTDGVRTFLGLASAIGLIVSVGATFFKWWRASKLSAIAKTSD